MNARLLLCFCLLLLLAACQGASGRQGGRGYAAGPARNLVVETVIPATSEPTHKLALVIGSDDYPEVAGYGRGATVPLWWTMRGTGWP